MIVTIVYIATENHANDVYFRYMAAGRNSRASFPVDTKTTMAPLPPLSGVAQVGQMNANGEVVNMNGKKVVKVMSRYSKAAEIMQSTSNSTLPQISNGKTGRRKTFGAH